MTQPAREIQYLSDPEMVSMGDDWFQFAHRDHFWMKRRFDVFERLASGIFAGDSSDPGNSGPWAEVGCGHGVVQRQFEDHRGVAVDGMDLNDYALKQNQASEGKLICYNVFDRAESLRHAYGHVILFDVIEHMDDDGGFVDAVSHLLEPGGSMVVNVPAFMHLYSKYDVAAGHVRRYNIGMMRQLAEKQNLTIQRWTYWGASLVPLLYARKAMLAVRRSDDIIEQGFAVKRSWLNALLYRWSRLEWIPQHAYGTSLMVWLTKNG